MRILIVEDDSDTRKVMRKILQHAAYEVFSAENGLEALEILDTQNIDIILTDLMMPKLSGIELLNQLRTSPRTSKIPVILCSSVSEQSQVVEAISLGASEYLLKPVKKEDLLKKVSKVAGKVAPVLEDSRMVAIRLKMGPKQYQELLGMQVEKAKNRLREAGARLEAGDCEAFKHFVDDLSRVAEKFGAKSLQRAAWEAKQVAPNAENMVRVKHLLGLKSELERLQREVTELKAQDHLMILIEEVEQLRREVADLKHITSSR